MFSFMIKRGTRASLELRLVSFFNRKDMLNSPMNSILKKREYITRI